MSQNPNVNFQGSTINNARVVGSQGVNYTEQNESGIRLDNEGTMNMRDVIRGNSENVFAETQRTINQASGSYYQEGQVTGGVSVTNNAEQASAEKCFKDRTTLSTEDIHVQSCTTRFYKKYQSDPDVYPVNNPGQSRALIINNVKFENRPDNVRHGAEKDSENLKILLIGLGFKVEIRQSLEKEEIEEVIEEFLNSSRNFAAPMSLVYIGSHGGQNQQDKRDYFYSGDWEKVYIEDLCQKFSASQCPGLAGKPKIFLFQFCRGLTTTADRDEERDRAYKFNTNWLKNDAQVEGEGSAKENADMLLAFATASGNSAYRNAVNGSWFTTSLCKVLMEEAKNDDLLSILTKVNSVVMRKRGSGQQEQMTEVTHTLSKKILFFPKNPSM
ncbi:caspase-6-like isoform X1 [Clavelina lepadiformis]|uniref:caspase-6-like isoform X1 n=1 Tax=Clavelina lepadiformis TaxID=159417 RepID=UPI0040410830